MIIEPDKPDLTPGKATEPIRSSIRLNLSGSEISMELPPRVLAIALELSSQDFQLNQVLADINTGFKNIDEDRYGNIFAEDKYEPTLKEIKCFLFSLKNYTAIRSQFDENKKDELDTNILNFAKRLDLNSEFENAKTKEEREKIWTFLLLYLLNIKVEQKRENASEIFDKVINVVAFNIENEYVEGCIVNKPQDFLQALATDLTRQKAPSKLLLEVWGCANSWKSRVEEGEAITNALFESFIHSMDEPVPDLSRAIVEAVREQRKLLTQLAILQNAVKPDSTEKEQAWYHPVDSIAKQYATQDLIVLYPRTNYHVFHRAGEKYPNTFLFEEAFFEKLGNLGFKDWAIFDSEQGRYTLESIVSWLSQNDDSRATPVLFQLLQEYFNLHRGNKVPSLRSYLSLPDIAEPVEVTHSLKHLESLWDIKEKVGAEVSFFQKYHTQGQPEFDAWFRGVGNGTKKIYLGRAEALESNIQTLKEKKVVTIGHYVSTPDYESDALNVRDAISHVAHNLGESLGWGDYNTVSVPVKGNQRLLNTDDEELNQALAVILRIPLVGIPLFSIPLFNASLYDSVVIVCESKDEGNTPELNPEEINVKSPKVLV